MDNLLSAPILFFLLGAIAALIRSDLAIPGQISKALSLYLLIAIGVHGGVELSAAGIDGRLIATLGVAMASSAIVPMWAYPLLKKSLGGANAAAVAACYGSVSAVTFVTACAYLTSINIEFSGAMVAAMALMESPAIVVGVALARTGDRSGEGINWKAMAHESLTGGPVVLLLGGLLIGVIIGKEGWEELKPFAKYPFKGILCLFLLDMGMVAAQRIGALRGRGWVLWVFSFVAPVVHGFVGIAVAYLLGLQPGDALLLAILFGSASYIAVPAAMRLSVPKADPGLYVPMALGLTFPFNVIIGIPLHYAVISAFW